MTVQIMVPATSANLGVGFDVVGLALDLHLTVGVDPIDGRQSRLVVEGEGAGRLGVDVSNRFVAGFNDGWHALSSEWVPALDIRMSNEIPLGRGLGSSAAATVAGLLAAESLAGAELGMGGKLQLATEIEGHPDNAAAALLGGFVVVADGRVVRLAPPAGLRCVLFVPERELATADMRRVLPDAVSRADAVHNSGRLALLVAGFATGDLALLSSMNDDRLHEPYRQSVFPELGALKSAAMEAGALGAALSGAGSSVLALTDENGAQAVALALEQAADRAHLAGTIRLSRPALAGASVT